MPEAIEFDPALYRGTAGYYDRFRVPYPQGLFHELVCFAAPGGHGRLMDLAGGTGQIAFALADRFAEVWAVDQEADMIEVVRDKTRTVRAGHVRPVVARAEDLAAPSRAFVLAAIGNAFHRVRRNAVAANVHRWSLPNGHIALLWRNSP